MTSQTAAAGEDIDAFCGKCRLDLAHIIIATTKGRAPRVQCKTCGAQHALRKTAAAKKRTPATAKEKSAKAAKAAGLHAYEDLSRGKDLSQSKRYSPKEVFALGEVMDHPTFGIGIVGRVLSDGKVETVFATAGQKLLVHSR